MSKTPWEFSKPASKETGVPNLPSDIGAELGAELARLTEPELAKLQKELPSVPPPCSECAFVKGTTPNRCGQTLMDAIKCVVEDEPFYCHKGVDDQAEPERLCTGYLAASGARERLKAVTAVVERLEKLRSDIEKYDVALMKVAGPRPPRELPL